MHFIFCRIWYTFCIFYVDINIFLLWNMLYLPYVSTIYSSIIINQKGYFPALVLLWINMKTQSLIKPSSCTFFKEKLHHAWMNKIQYILVIITHRSLKATKYWGWIFQTEGSYLKNVPSFNGESSIEGKYVQIYLPKMGQNCAKYQNR